eukprot:TCONS_00049317-protein
MEESKAYKEWIKRRERTKYVGYFLMLLYGLESNAVLVSLMYYLAESFGMDDQTARTYFSISEMFNAVGQFFGGLLLGRYTDVTRNLRYAFLVNLFAICVGNLMYSLNFNIWLLLIGRLLCGLNEALQTSLGGEFRRCYKDKELIDVFGWYEIWFSVGINVGPGMPVFFSWVNIKLGRWKIDKYNALNVVLSLIGFIIFILSYFFVADLSKELDHLKKEYENTNEMETPEKQEDVKELSPSKTEDAVDSKFSIMELVQVDIVSLVITYGVIRYATSSLLSMISMYAMSLFHWGITFLSWMHLCSGFAVYAFIIVLIKYDIFQGVQRMYYFYVSSSIFALVAFIVLMLPRLFNITSFPEQITYLVIGMLIKCWIYFHAQSSGKVLLFTTVTPDKSCTIDGVRSTFGATMKLLALATGFLFFETPQWFVLPIGIIQFLAICIVLYRHHIYFAHNTFQ